MSTMDLSPHRKPLSHRHAVLRELIIEASLEVLDRDGLALGVDAIAYSRVFDYLEREHEIRITRGSVHGRIWDSHDDYRNDVLLSAVRHTSPHGDTKELLEAVLVILQLVDEQRLDHRERVKAFCRIGGLTLLHGYLGSPRFRRFQAIKAVARGSQDGWPSSVLQSMIGEMADGNRTARIQAFAFVFRALGLRPKPALELDETQAVGCFLTLVQTLVTGAHLDHHAGFVAIASEVDTGMPAEPDQPWTFFGFGFLASMDLLFEEDPAAVPVDLDPSAVAAELDPALEPGEQVPSHEPGRRRRRSRKELRDLVVGTGEHLLLRDGIALTPSSLTYAAVFDHIKKTRGVTIHRSTVHNHIWSSQDEFRADVLAEAARYPTSESLSNAQLAMAAQSPVRHPDGSLNFRQMILDTSLAVVTAQMLISSSSPSFRRWQSIKASMLSRDAEDQYKNLPDAVGRRYEEVVEALADLYRPVLPLVGLRVNPDLQISSDEAHRLFSVVGATFTSGADFNISAGATAAAQTIPIPRTDGSGRKDDWPIQALASLAALDLLFVPEAPSS